MCVLIGQQREQVMLSSISGNTIKNQASQLVYVEQETATVNIILEFQQQNATNRIWPTESSTMSSTMSSTESSTMSPRADSSVKKAVIIPPVVGVAGCILV